MTDSPFENVVQLALQQIRPHFAWLRNPLPPGPDVCQVCHGQNRTDQPACSPCIEHFETPTPYWFEDGPSSLGADQMLADAVVPISYAVSDMQHARHLRSYKYSPPTPAAYIALNTLLYTFIAVHLECLCHHADGMFTHYTTVPSTKNRVDHPLAKMCSRLPWEPLTATTAPGAFNGGQSRRLDLEAFNLNDRDLNGARVLLVDDTWTTGARVQSMSYALKRAGAYTVVALVLGRWVNTNFNLGRQFTESIRNQPHFDPYQCTVHQPSDSPRYLDEPPF